MSYKHVLYERDPETHVATVTLNKPERLNAIDLDDHLDLVALADEAYRIGPLDRLFEADQLLPTAQELAERICELPPAAIRVTKRAIRAGLEASFAEATRNETRYGGLARGARRDAEESISAFRERRSSTSVSVVR